MTNHVHLLLRPKKEESLAKMMQGVALCYTQYINKRYKRTGRLWESRFHSCIIDEESYLWSVARYIEQNPSRARIVKNPEDYPYSSASAHIKGIKDNLLTEELFDEGEREEYLKIIKGEAKEAETDSIRKSTKTGKPLGDKGFIKRISELLKVNFITKKTCKRVK
jgi:putative transposase